MIHHQIREAIVFVEPIKFNRKRCFGSAGKTALFSSKRKITELGRCSILYQRLSSRILGVET
jgi:hypothetical protein